MSLFDRIITEAADNLGLGKHAAPLTAEAVRYLTDPATGGIRGAIERFGNAGLGELAASWVGKGEEPTPLTIPQIERALGADLVQRIAKRLALGNATVKSALAYLVPEIVATLTPQGVIPETLPPEVDAFLESPRAKAPEPRVRPAPAPTLGAAETRRGLFRGWPVIVLAAVLLGYWILRGSQDETEPPSVAPSIRPSLEEPPKPEPPSAEAPEVAAPIADAPAEPPLPAPSVRPSLAEPPKVDTESAAAPPAVAESGGLFQKPDSAAAPAPEAASPEAASDRMADLKRVVIRFRYRGIAIPAASRPSIGEAVKAIQDLPATTVIEIGGHTDGQGDDAANRAISLARAEAVRHALIGAGVQAERLVVKGYGSSRPIASNSTREGRAENRRVEFREVE